MSDISTMVMPDLSESAFEILQTAVTESCERQIKSIQALRERLNALYPGCHQHIEEAITYWSASVRRRGTPE